MTRRTIRIEQAPELTRAPLADAYVHSFERIASLYDFHPYRPDGWRERLEWLDSRSHPNASKEALSEVLIAYNERIGNSQEAIQGAKELAQSGTVAVVGGQQAVAFTGPLLVLHKAVTILSAARRAERELGRRVVPVFWVAGEDHDWDEVNHTYGITKEQEIQKIKINVKQDEPPRTSVSYVSMNQLAWEDALEQFEGGLLDTEFKPDLIITLRKAFAESSSPSDCFARIMASLFGKHGLVLVDSADPAVRSLEREMFQQLIRRRADYGNALEQGRSAVEQAGFTAEAEVRSDSLQLFVLHEGERLLMYGHAGGGFSDRKGRLPLTEEQLLHYASEEPERLSNNVLTRPVMQEYLFPVLATVLGPSEVAYWGLLRHAFHSLDMKMPIVVPRTSFTMIEGTVHKNLEKYGVALGQALNGQELEKLKMDWLARQDQWGVEARFAAAEDAVNTQYGPLLEMIEEIQPALRKLGDTNLLKIQEQIAFLKQKTMDALQSRHEAGVRQFERIGRSLLPLGKPQERVYNGFVYLSKYGTDWLDQLVEQELDLHGGHYAVYL
ncbi:bacillithiol biosynthesis cysteine-adding enzyme BshC [Paenibacillus turpanensis]|uniref:bacillithiol biosynthesis cysteine-adding enzyme BshC n=1 Tax=Paenibacillus turpanensis TaxID=2689078 RepID=UPI00140E77DB|nr:bacillithiol biosynthesis cysteine-adding enzyme BshC [Paenibacillus turpanensis]